MNISIEMSFTLTPWNKGKLVGQKVVQPLLGYTNEAGEHHARQ